MIEDKLLATYAGECRAAGHRAATVHLRLSYLHRVPQPLLTATRADLVDWLAMQEWRPETLRSAIAALRSFYRWAVDEQLIAADPAAKLKPVRVPTAEPHPTPDDVFELALLAASDRVQLMIGLAAWAGLRRAEIASLRWADVRSGRLFVEGKGGKQRQIAIAPRLGDLLAAELARRHLGRHGTGWRFQISPTSDWVFPARSGEGHTAAYTVGDTLAHALGGDWSGHSLRHRFATRAYAAQRDLLTVQRMLGHSRPETTARYASPPPDAELAAVLAAAA